MAPTELGPPSGDKAFKPRVRVQKETVSRFVTFLKRCTKVRDLETGKVLHRDAIEARLHTHKSISDALITMYGKCHRMGLARQVFDEMPHKNVVTWTCLILGYVENGDVSTAMELFTVMDCQPDSFTYAAVLKACGLLATERESEKRRCLMKGMAIHRQVRELGFGSDVVVANTLVDMYSKCGSVHRAREVFDGMTVRTVVSWTSLILGYVMSGEHLEALRLFSCMDCEPDSFTYVAVLKACGGLAAENELERSECLKKGLVLHRRIEELGLDSQVLVATTLVDMYTKCGSMERAKRLFDRMKQPNVVARTSLMLGYIANGECLAALLLFESIDCEPSSVTYVAALKACEGLGTENDSEKRYYLNRGMTIHKELTDRGFQSNVVVSNTLIDMYSKLESLERAKSVFDEMTHRTVVSWTSLIQGYVENQEYSRALALFTSMEESQPNYVTFIAALKACGGLAALPTGRLIHARVSKAGLEQAQVVGNNLIDVYVKCGSLSRAEEVFNAMQSRDLVSWNTLVGGYSSLGDSSQVFGLAEEMENAGVRVDAITFTCILTACSHAGLVDEARFYFELMKRYGVRQSVEHYNCMVDVLGRGNRVEEALRLVQRMTVEANGVTWRTLLAACRKWKNVEVGKVAFDALGATGTRTAAAYLMMRDIYTSLRMWKDIANLETEQYNSCI